MNVIYQPSAKQWREGYALLQQAKQILEEVIGQSADPVNGEWTRSEDPQGRQVFTLRLADWSGAVTAIFSPEELQKPDHLRARFNRLWGDLLQIRANQLLQKLLSDG